MALFWAAAPAAAERLPGTAVPEHYELWFAPDFQKDNFRGRATIRLRLKEPARSVTLHAVEIEFGRVRITAAGRGQDATVSWPACWPARGRATWRGSALGFSAQSPGPKAQSPL